MPPKAAAKRRDIPPPVKPVLPRTRSTRSAARKDNVDVVASKDDEDAHDDHNTRTDNVAPQGNNSGSGRNTRSTTRKDATSDKVTVAAKVSSKKTAEASCTTDIPISKRGPPRGVNPDAEPARRKGGNMSDNLDNISGSVFFFIFDQRSLARNLTWRRSSCNFPSSTLRRRGIAALFDYASQRVSDQHWFLCFAIN